MKSRKLFVVLAFLALSLAVVVEVMMLISSLLDGKYALTESNYLLHITSFSIALLISNVVIFGLLVWIVKLLKRE
jgi:hypothetical protein